MATVKLISSDDLKRSLPQEEAATFDTGFAAWVIDMVSARHSMKRNKRGNSLKICRRVWCQYSP